MSDFNKIIPDNAHLSRLTEGLEHGYKVAMVDESTSRIYFHRFMLEAFGKEFDLAPSIAYRAMEHTPGRTSVLICDDPSGGDAGGKHITAYLTTEEDPGGVRAMARKIRAKTRRIEEVYAEGLMAILDDASEEVTGYGHMRR